MVLDGTLIAVDRVAADRRFYSGKHKTWRILRKLRYCPWCAGQLTRAIHVLQIREAKAG